MWESYGGFVHCGVPDTLEQPGVIVSPRQVAFQRILVFRFKSVFDLTDCYSQSERVSRDASIDSAAI